MPFNYSCNEEKMKYKDADLPIEERVQDLLSRMTLEEKVAQMLAVNSEVKDSIEISEDGKINIDKIKSVLKNGIGQITRVSETRGGVSQTSDKGEKGMTAYENAVLTNFL